MKSASSSSDTASGFSPSCSRAPRISIPTARPSLSKSTVTLGAISSLSSLCASQAEANIKRVRLIPLCHTLPLTHVDVRLAVVAGAVEIEASAETTAQTGVEMEALTAVSVAALTLYDMAKAIDKAMTIEDIRVVEKTKELT